MRAFLLVLWSVVVLATGFFIGGNYGWHLMDEKCGLLVLPGLPSYSSNELKKHIAILDALSSGDTQTAKAITVKLSRSEATIVGECRNNPDCMKYAPSYLSERATSDALERAKSLE
jgi:hypothetical protein